MTASNTNAAGMSLAPCEPMLPIPGANISSNTRGVPNVANYFCCGGNEQNLATIRTGTQSVGSITGIVSGTHSASMVPVQGSSKYFLHAMPVTRLGDSGMTNQFNASTSQVVPSQTKYFVNA